MSRKRWISVSLALFAITTIGCSKDSNPVDNTPSELPNKLYEVEATYIRNIDFFPDVTPRVIHDVSVHLLTYPTMYKGTSLTVSGVIVIPQGLSDPSIIVDCHGTIQSDDSAPSHSTAQKPLRFTQLAAAGYIVFAPDYVGFGESVAEFHPWLIAEPGAQAVVDMVTHGKQLLEDHDVPYTDEIFLTGYSEGANFVLAAQQMIESNPGLGINLIASAPSSGAYDMEMTFTRRIAGTDAAEAVGAAYLILAFRDFYDWQNPLDDFFKEPYRSEFAQILQMSGSFEDNIFGSPNQIVDDFVNGTLTQEALLTDAFRSNPSSEPRSKFNNRLSENNVHEWTPMTPTMLYYGKSDTTTFFENSINAYNRFIANGADPNTITLVGFDGKDHDGAESPSMRAALDWFATFEAQP